MKSRMDKYYKDEELMQRTSKNDSLYNELYREKQIPRSNVTVIDNINEIDITKIKDMVDSRETYKRVRHYENIINPVEAYRNKEIDYQFDEIDYSNYDINEILKNKRSDKVYETDPTKVRRISNIDYDLLSSLEIKKEEDELSDDLLNHERQLKDLFNTVSRTMVNESTDLFSNLKEDVDNKKEDKVVKEETFYTSTSKFDADDFKDDVEEKKGSKIFVIIGITAMLIAIGIIVYIKFLK